MQKVNATIQWHPTSELPEIGERLLLATPSFILIGKRGGVLENENVYFIREGNLIVHGVKFWARLPDVPC